MPCYICSKYLATSPLVRLVTIISLAYSYAAYNSSSFSLLVVIPPTPSLSMLIKILTSSSKQFLPCPSASPAILDLMLTWSWQVGCIKLAWRISRRIVTSQMFTGWNSWARLITGVFAGEEGEQKFCFVGPVLFSVSLKTLACRSQAQWCLQPSFICLTQFLINELWLGHLFWPGRHPWHLLW